MHTNIAAEFTSVRNHNERAVFNAVALQADHHPGLADDPPSWRRAAVPRGF